MFPQELLLLLDNEKGGDAFPMPVEGRKTSPEKKRAVLMGQVWSAGLAETLMEVYAHLLTAGYSLEDVSRFVQEPFDDRSGD
jgi:hypothetical protein